MSAASPAMPCTGQSSGVHAACLVLCFCTCCSPGAWCSDSGWGLHKDVGHLTCTPQIRSLLLVFDLLCHKAARDVAASCTASWWDVGRKRHHCCEGQLYLIAGSR